MYTFEIMKKVDSKIWNSQLKKCNYATFYQTVECQKSDSTRFPLFIYIYDKNGSIAGQLAITVLKIQSVYSTSFLKKYVEVISKIGNRGFWANGPIIHSNNKKNRKQILEIFMNALDEIANKFNLMIIDGYSTPQDQLIDDEYLKTFRKNGYKIENFITFVFDLNKSLEDIWMNVKRYTRTNVKRAPKRNITIKELKSKEELKKFYDLAAKWGKTKGLKNNFSYSSLTDDWKKIEGKIDKFFLAYQDKELISAIRLSYFNGIASPTQVLSSYTKVASLGGPTLTWHAIKWAKESGLRIYDLTGGKAPPKNKETEKDYEKQWQSLLTYKRKWGGEEIPYYHFVKIKKKLSYKLFRALSKPDWAYRTYKKKKFVKPQKEN